MLNLEIESKRVGVKTNRRTQEKNSAMNANTAAGACFENKACISPNASFACPLSLPGVMDAKGRVDESRMRFYIFENGGVSPSERGQVWRFLFGMFPCSSTALERPLLLEQLAVRYQAMKRKWQRLLPSAVRLRLNGTDAELVAAVKYFEQQRQKAEQQSQEKSEEVQERLSFLELQAQVLLERVTFDLEELQEAIRIIDKDVPRTDRDLSYYSGEGSGNLLVLREVLITFAAFHPEVSYAQGMNDLCSRFLEVLDSEVDTYWSFSCYMERFSQDFCAEGMHRKIELEAQLLKELDPPLHAHLVTDKMDRLTFCHRPSTQMERNLFLCYPHIYGLCLKVMYVCTSPWNAQVPGTILALQGSCVVVPCMFSYPGPERKLTELTGIWNTEDQNLIYHPNASKVVQRFRGRTSLIGDLGRRNCSLKINRVKRGDTGPFLFRIVIDNVDKYSYRKSSVFIVVKDVPQKPSVTVSGKVMASQSVVTSCSVIHTCPPRSSSPHLEPQGINQRPVREAH